MKSAIGIGGEGGGIEYSRVERRGEEKKEKQTRRGRRRQTGLARQSEAVAVYLGIDMQLLGLQLVSHPPILSDQNFASYITRSDNAAATTSSLLCLSPQVAPISLGEIGL